VVYDHKVCEHVSLIGREGSFIECDDLQVGIHVCIMGFDMVRL